MANQIVVSAGAKVRNLDGVLTATSGVVSSVPLGAANGVATLDSGGKVPVSQLPSSVVTYLGTWNAATNTPTLVNGVGDAGDMYICNVAGTVNFGAGPVTFAVGDWVLYGSGTWQKSNGQNGTVTSVGLSTNGGAITIGNSPITTSGVISANFNGTNLQYVNGAGNLTTFPTLMTSVGLTMPSAFTVTNSPLTGAGGTLAVTGAGTTAQYIRGDGSLATFPTIATEAQRLITEVYNETGATLSKGTVVYINGGHGNLPTITKALATGDATSAQTYGIVQTDITNMNNGYVVVIGSLTDLDTSAYVEGTQLYLSSTTAGAWTSVKQYAPAHLVYVAIVTRSHPTQGVVEVMIQNGFEMDELHNVSAQSPLNNQGLFYNTSTSLWENKSIATALGYTPADDSLVVHLAGTETITGVKNFNIGLTLQTGYYPTPALGYVGLGSNGSGITILTKPVSTVYNNNLQFSAASNTYNFPAASGTIALTSDIPSLAGYVTLATTQTITGAKTFSGYTTFTSTVDITSGLTFSNSGFTLVLQPPTLSVNRTVTFADITGTIAMLEGTQTFTGAKTFDAAYFNGAEFINTAYFDKGLWLVKNGIPSVFTALQTTIYSESTSNNVIFRDNVSKAKLVFDNSTQTYTFPAASGTIALVGGSGVGTVTSVAALTIGTSGTDLSSSVANSTTTPVITLNVPTASATNRGALSSTDWTTFNNKQSALTNPVTGTGTTNYLPKFTGTSTIGNSILQENGTGIGIGGAATQKFSVFGSAALMDITSTTGTNFNGLEFKNTSGSFYVGQDSSTGGFYGSGLPYAASLYVSGNYPMVFFTNGTAKMTLTASGNLGLGVTPSAWGGSYKAVQIANSALWAATNDLHLTLNTLYDGAYKYIDSGYATRYNQYLGQHIWYTAPSGTAGNAITFTQAMTLDASGNLSIGVINPNTRLHIKGLNQTNGTVQFEPDAAKGIESSFIHYGATGDWYIRSASTSGKVIINDGGGNVLIGTTTDAGYKLDVNGTGRFSGNAFSNSAFIVSKNGSDTIGSGAFISLQTATGTNYQNNIQLNASGGMDIWTYNVTDSWVKRTTFANNGAATFSSSVTATSGIINGTTDAFFDINRSASGNAGRVRFQTAGTDEFEIGLKGGVAGFHITKGDATELVTVLTSGNVGIGTTSPFNKLTVGSVPASGYGLITISSDWASGTAISTGIKIGAASDTGAAGVDIRSHSNYAATSGTEMSFWTNSTGNVLSERMRITSGGNVEIASGSIKTGTPSGGTAKPWKLGQDTSTLYSATRTIQVEIDGGTYYLLAVKSTDL